jgi:hypothetical protein
MEKRTRSSQPQLSLLARYECAPRYDIVHNLAQRRELVRSLAELLLEAAHHPAPADAVPEEPSDE